MRVREDPHGHVAVSQDGGVFSVMSGYRGITERKGPRSIKGRGLASFFWRSISVKP